MVGRRLRGRGRRLTFAGRTVLRFDFFSKKCGSLDMSHSNCQVERSLAIGVFGIRVGSGVQEHFNNFDVAVPGSNVEGCVCV